MIQTGNEKDFVTFFLIIVFDKNNAIKKVIRVSFLLLRIIVIIRILYFVIEIWLNYKI